MRRSVFAAVVVMLAGAAALVAQQKPTFKSGVEVVLLDVNVVDQSHAPVTDLKPGDFVVSVDRKPRKVVSAQFVRYDVRTSTTKERDKAPLSGATAPATTPDRPPARNVLIAIDTDSMEPGDGLLVRQEASKFVDNLAPDDRVGVVTIPRVQSVVTMTKIREQVRAELAKVITGAERYRSLQFSVGMAEAFDVERGDAVAAQKIIWRNCCKTSDTYPCTPAFLDCPEQVNMEIRQMQLQSHLRGERSVEALRDLGESLSRIDGPKTLVYVTGGLPAPDIKSVTAYSHLGTAFAAAQISLYTLYIQQERVVQVKERATPGDRESPMGVADTAAEREGVENATGAANGILMEVVGTFDQYFDLVVTELSGAYVIGIEVQASDRDGKPHEVSVKVNRNSVDVRARRHYVIEPAGKAAPGESASPSGITAAVPRPPVTVIPPNPASTTDATPKDVQPLVDEMAQYVRAYEGAFLALLSDERADLKLSKWAVQAGTGGWTVERQRRLAAENLLVKRPGGAGWTALRDVFEVDGRPIRARDGRLRTMFLEAPDTIIERASEMTAASAANDIGFVDRRMNAATSALVFLSGDNRTHFVFVKQGEQVVAGVPAWQVAFAERSEPAFVRGQAGGVPVSGTLWVDPKEGTILRTVVRWEVNGTTAEITVNYAKATDGSMWVPGEMAETYNAGSVRLECVTKFANYRRYEGS
jgi:VWFA-related protein